MVAAVDDVACEHFGGQVQTRRVEWETLRGKRNFVILEYVPIGVCDRGAARDFDASILRRVADVDRGRASRNQTLDVPVARGINVVRTLVESIGRQRFSRSVGKSRWLPPRARTAAATVHGFCLDQAWCKHKIWCRERR